MATRKAVEELFERISQIHPEVIEWRHHLHQYPELSNRETKTADFIVQRLREFGFDSADIRTGLGGHGVLAALKGQAAGESEKAILLRADIDALPVKEDSGLDFASQEVDTEYPGGPFPIAHACGHDCHTAMLLGAARVLAQRREDFAGTVYFAFQPAEEGAPVGEEGGAKLMLEDAVFDQLDPQPQTSFGMHVMPLPKGSVSYRTGVQHASSERVKITIHGEQVHGSMPWEGIDPLPAAADVISAMGQIYRQFNSQDAFTISLGHVEDQGRFNIVGGAVTLWGTVRCLKDGMMEEVNEKIARTATHIAQAYGCTAEAEFDQYVPAVVNSPEDIEAMLPAFEAAAGAKERVGEVPALMGYDDVSEFINRYGGVYALLGVQDAVLTEEGQLVPEEGGRGVVPNHSPKFYADDDALETGVRLHVAVALTHLAGLSGKRE
ncbi:M20 family metallopeptidase [Corynebacterium sp.]|uniref:M20 metallopeptidase family protein n=1 Tax=Corynebacterium sp. TaxID=1720 RepID=UPI0026DDB612|nr:amidohydrolase [Corynebacterium sp.]MDO5031093.1 amidohydrolase [Corynebacterium sp.]